MEKITLIVNGKEVTIQVESLDEMYNEIEKRFGFKVAEQWLQTQSANLAV